MFSVPPLTGVPWLLTLDAGWTLVESPPVPVAVPEPLLVGPEDFDDEHAETTRAVATRHTTGRGVLVR
jgi:hypothetical protein